MAISAADSISSRSSAFRPSGAASCCHSEPAMRETCRACGRSTPQFLANSSTAARRSSAGTAGRRRRLLHHREQQAVAHAAGVHLHHVHAQLPHDPLDDRQAGDDDVGPLRAESPATLQRSSSDMLARSATRWRICARVTRKPHIGWPAIPCWAMMIDASAVNVPPVPNSMSGTNGGLPTSFFSARSTKSRSFADALVARCGP